MKPEETLKKINAMQDLCVQVEQDNQKIEEIASFLQEARTRHETLYRFYQEEWSELLYDENGDTKEVINTILKEHLKHIPQGHYSITNQDTLWDALNDHRLGLIDLLKTLVEIID
jgi:hypothetical protein